jgi:anti-anti-sigma regulatory factor
MAAQVKIPEDFFIGTILDAVDGLLRALHENQEVVLDFSGVTRIDSAAIQAILAAKKEADCLGVTLTITQSDMVKNFASSIGVCL